jgi:tetratricopeptide (TPR) repeat protein
MMPSALRLGMHMESKSVVIEHHGYADVAIVKKKAARNIEMLLNSYDACGLDTVMAIEIADSYQLIENYIEAENWYQKVLSIPKCEEITPALAGQAYAGLGNIAHKLNKFDIAINNFKEALKISPWRADVLYTMAVALEMTGQIEDSCRSFYQVLKVVPTPGQVGVDFRAAKIKTYLRLSRILIERTMMNEAEIVLQAGRTEYPERPELLNLSGKFLIKSGKLIDALKTFEKSIFLIRDGNIDAYIGLCSIYKMAGKIDRARDALLSIEPLFSQNPKYIAFRSFILAESATAQKADNYCAIVTDLQKEFFHVF